MDAASVNLTLTINRYDLDLEELERDIGDALTALPAAALSFRIDAASLNGRHLHTDGDAISVK